MRCTKKHWLLLLAVLGMVLCWGNPIRAEEEETVGVVSVTAEDVTVVDGNQEDRYYWDEEAQENKTYPGFYLLPNLIVELDNGEIVSGEYDDVTFELSMAFDISIYALNSQKEDYLAGNPWSGGNTYTAMLRVGEAEASFNVTVLPSPVVSVSVDPVILRGDEGYEDSYWDAETQEEKSYTRYDVEPRNMTVEMTDETFSGDYWSIKNHLWENYGVRVSRSDTQTQDAWAGQPWTAEPGDVYTGTVTAGGKKVEYEIRFEAYPIQSIEADPVEVVEGNGYQDTYWDDESEEDVPYFRFNDTMPQTVKVTLTDGEVISGDYYDVQYQVHERVGEWIGWEDNQYSSAQNGNPWTVGNTYAGTIYAGGGKVSSQYSITVVSSPVVSVSADPIVLTEDAGYEDSYWDVEAQEYKPFTRYDVEPENVTVELTDGTTLSGSYWTVQGELRENYGVDLNYSHTQYQDARAGQPWTAGNTYAGTIYVGEVKSEYPITINPSRIVSVSADPIVLTEENGWEDDYWDEESESYVVYTRYNTRPQNVTVVLTDGTTLSGSYWTVQDELWANYRANLNYSDTQDQDAQAGQPWMAEEGNVYTGTITAGAKKAAYEIRFEAYPIQSIEADPVEVMDGNGYESQYWDYGSQAYVPYFRYNYTWPQTVKVTLKDGEVISGDYEDVRNQIGERFGEWIDWGDNQHEDARNGNAWTVGNTYAGTIYVGSGKVNSAYPITVNPSPVVSVSADPIVLTEDDGYEDSYWDEAAQEDKPFTRYDVRPENVTVELTDGTILSGPFGYVQYMLQENYRVDLDYSHTQYQDARAGHPWMAEEGNVYTATISAGGQEAEYEVRFEAYPIQSVEADPVEVMDGNGYERQYWDDESQAYVPFFYFGGTRPQTVKVTLTDGEVISGDFNDVRDQIQERFGEWIDWYDDQYSAAQNGNAWTAGNTYAGTIYVGSGKVNSTYPISVVPHPVVDIQADPLGVMEGSQEERWYWDEETESEEEWPCYVTPPRKVTVTLDNGDVISGSLGYVNEELYKRYPSGQVYVSYDYSTKQFEDYQAGNPWEPGVHEGEIYSGKLKKTYKIIVQTAEDLEKKFDVFYMDGLDGKLIKSDTKILSGGSSTEPEAPAHEGYRFTGWEKTAGESAKENVLDNLIYTATYEKLPATYRVVYLDGLTGTTIKENTEIALHGQSTRPEAPVHEGYTLKEWVQNKGESKEADVTDDQVWVAVYEPVQKKSFTVIYMDGVSGETIRVDGEIPQGGSSTAPKAPEHEGYTFKSWTKTYGSSEKENVGDNLIYTATYEKVEEPATETDEPATEEPSKEEPATEEPSKEEPATEEPATEEPSKEEPATEEPATEEPATEPATEEPATEPAEPATEPAEPATEPAEPAAEAEEPATEPPATAPATEAPATVPATEAATVPETGDPSNLALFAGLLAAAASGMGILMAKGRKKEEE